MSDSGLRRPEHQHLLQRTPASVEQVLLADALFAHISPVDTPSGLVALIELPPAAAPRALDADVLVLDGVQDPGNLGTILRTAAAAGLRDVLLTEGCAQAWAPRVLRAGMGAHFMLHIEERVDACERLAGYQGCRVATALGDEGSALYALDLQGPVAWLFGAEGQGLSPSVLAAADRRVMVPMAAGVESLNVGAAVAVCLFEQRRQRGLR